MNYTKNFHLPQWDEDDRIMRTDFNSAMAGIEEGLNGNAAVTDTLSQSTVMQNKKVMDRLSRLAYNHYCTVQDMDPFPGQIGIFHQNFGRDPSGLSGTIAWHGMRFAGKSSVALTGDTISYQTLTPLRIVKNNLAASTPLTGKFRAPAPGYVNSFHLTGNYINSTVNADFRLRITLTNQETGGAEYSVIATFTNTQDNGGFSYYVKAPLYFLGGVDYLITAQPLDAICDMKQAEFDFKNSVAAATVSNEGAVSVSRVFREPEGGSGGIAILRCVIGGAGGTMRFRWDGAEMQPHVTRIARMSSGRAFREFIYLRHDAIPESSSLSLRFECGEGGSILLSDWGMMMF